MPPEELDAATAVQQDPERFAPGRPDEREDVLIESDELVEDVSIDGMCGVY